MKWNYIYTRFLFELLNKDGTKHIISISCFPVCKDNEVVTLSHFILFCIPLDIQKYSCDYLTC